jgi:hypothetical protein
MGKPPHEKLRRHGPGGCPGRASLVGAGRRLRFLAQNAVALELVKPNRVAARDRSRPGGIRPTTKWIAQRRRLCSLPDDRHVKKLLRSLGVFLSLEHTGPAMTDFKTADPKQDVLCDVRGVVGDSLEVS